MSIRIILSTILSTSIFLAFSGCGQHIQYSGYKFVIPTTSTQEVTLGAVAKINYQQQLKELLPVKVSGRKIYSPRFKNNSVILRKNAIWSENLGKHPESKKSIFFESIDKTNCRAFTLITVDEHLSTIRADRNALAKLRSYGKRGKVITAILTTFDSNLIQEHQLGTYGQIDSLGIRIPILMSNSQYKEQLIRFEDVCVIGYRYARPVWSKNGALIQLNPDMEWTICGPVKFPNQNVTN